MTNLDSELKSRNITDKGLYSQSSGFSISHVRLWELDLKEGWVLKNWCFWTVVLVKTFESLLDNKEIRPANPKWNQPWLFIGRIDAETKAPVLSSPDVMRQLIRKDHDAGKDFRQEKGMTENELVGCHHRFNGCEFGQTLEDSEGQGSMVCCSSRGCKELDTTEWLTNKNHRCQ